MLFLKFAKMKKVLVIVVTYNGTQWLDRCLSSVAREADLFVVDNDSTDGSADYVQAHFPDTKLVRSAENLGFSRPNNMGMQYALDKGYEYVYLLNQDAWLEEGALDKLVAVADAHPEYGVLSPLQYQDGYKNLDREFSKILRRAQNDKSCSYCLDVPRVMASHWLIPTRVIRRIGLFEQALFPHWGQDDDWCNRLHFCGLKVGVVPAARAVHDRACRKDSLEVLIKRNYYTGSLVRLANPARPLSLVMGYFFLFTLVKFFKYRSLLVFKYFRQVLDQLDAVKASRARSIHAR